MAEGLISSDHKGRDETLSDVAGRYLNELASKCMVQVKMTDTVTFMDGLKSCRLHDLVRDLCLSKVKAEKFFGDSQGKIRRLAINLDTNTRVKLHFKNANVRSILLLNRGFDVATYILQNILSNALVGSLKVLVLENSTFKDDRLPDAVRKLVMLKHFSIRGSYVVKVPKFVCKLTCLQSMDLRTLGDVTLPNSMDKMGRLRHLFLGATEVDGGRPWSLKGLTELETLIGFSSEMFETNHLLKLTNLRHFGGSVYDIESLSVVVDHITELKDQLRETSLGIYVRDLSSQQGSLHMSSLMRCPLNHLKIHGRLRRLPAWEPQLLQKLISLSLFGSEILEDPMETLQRLPTLVSLTLDLNLFVGTEMVCGKKGFPQLKKLTLASLSNLVGWRVEEDAMPNLSDLNIYHCPKLKMIPQGIIFMDSITNLQIADMPKSFMERLRSEGGEDYHKISHIPFIHLGIQDSSSGAE